MVHFQKSNQLANQHGSKAVMHYDTPTMPSIEVILGIVSREGMKFQGSFVKLVTTLRYFASGAGVAGCPAAGAVSGRS
jgi:hypothetical protein